MTDAVTEAVSVPSWWPRVRTALLAVVLAGMSAFVVIRLVGLDAGTILAVPMALFPYTVIGGLILLLIALLVRARWLTGWAAVLVVVQLVLIVPRFIPVGTEVSASAPRLRVGTSNTHVGAVNPKALVDMVRSQRLDVLATEELTADGVRALDEAGLRELMPYRELRPEIDSSIYSRGPLSNGGLLNLSMAWPQPTATITVGGRAVRLVAVHTYYPVGNPDQWTHDLAALHEVVGRDAVVLGDFNATLDHGPMRSLLNAGLVDTHAELGRWAPTWPVGAIAPPLAQIDHVLHGAGLAAVSASEYTLPGTDHRAVVAELALVDVTS